MFIFRTISQPRTLESFRFEDENEDEDEDEALGFRHKEIFKLFRLQLGRDDEVDCNNIVPAKLKTKRFEDFLAAKTERFVLVLVFVLVLESKALYYQPIDQPPEGVYLLNIPQFLKPMDNKLNSLNLAAKICSDICPWTLSVPRSSQFSSSFALGKLFASRNR